MNDIVDFFVVFSLFSIIPLVGWLLAKRRQDLLTKEGNEN